MAKASSNVLYLGLETGGKKVAAVVCDREHRVLSEAGVERPAQYRAEETLSLLGDVAERALGGCKAGMGELKAAGWGFGGMVDRARNMPHRNPHEKGWDEIPDLKALEERLGTPVFVENDCNIAALGECHLGAGEREGIILYVTVGSGIGCGIIYNGRILQGSRFGEGEVGHIVMDPGGLECPCGNRGCLEATCSGDGLGRLARHVSSRFIEESSLASRIGPMKDRAIAPHLFEQRETDPLARYCIEHFSENMGQACSILSNLFNPRRIIFGGGVMAYPWLYDAFREVMQTRVAPQIHANFELVPARLGKRVVPLGAAVYAAMSAEGDIS